MPAQDAFWQEVKSW